MIMSFTSHQLHSAHYMIFPLFIDQNICCVYSKEPPQYDYFAHPKQMLKLMKEKKIKFYAKTVYLDLFAAFVFGPVHDWQNKNRTKQQQKTTTATKSAFHEHSYQSGPSPI